MAHTAELSIVDVTDLRFSDSDPVFTVDGKHLAFLSERNFDPMYDAHVFDLSFPHGARPFLVPLAATTPSPFAPELRGRPVGDNESKEDDEVSRTVVDVEGLADRVVPFPVPAARYSTMRAVKGAVLWVREPIGGVLGHDLATPDDERPSSALERFDLAKRRVRTMCADVDDVWVSGDGERVMVWDGTASRFCRPTTSPTAATMTTPTTRSSLT
jgi:tricorn protease